MTASKQRLWTDDDITFSAAKLAEGGAPRIAEFMHAINDAVPPWMARILKRRLEKP